MYVFYQTIHRCYNLIISGQGFINQDTIMTSRINGQLHDYILEGEPIKPHEIITIEKVSDVLKELETCKFPNITFNEVK